MGRLEEGAFSQLKFGEASVDPFRGTTAGLKARASADRQPALLYVTPSAVVVSAKSGVLGLGLDVQRFEAADIVSVRAEIVDVSGVKGMFARQNETSPVGRALGATSAVPAVVLRTRRGEIVFAFKPRQADAARDATAAVAPDVEINLLRRPRRFPAAARRG